MAQYLDETGLKLLWGATKDYVSESQKNVTSDIEDMGQKAVSCHLRDGLILVRRSGGPLDLYRAKTYISVGDVIGEANVEKVTVSAMLDDMRLSVADATSTAQRVMNVAEAEYYASASSGTCEAPFARFTEILVVLTVSAGGKDAKTTVRLDRGVVPEGASRWSCRIAGADTYIDIDRDASAVTVGKVTIDGKEQTPKIDVYYKYY